MKKITLLIASLFMTIGAMAQVKLSTTLPEEGTPEYLYYMCNGGGKYVPATTAYNSSTDVSTAGAFAFYASGTDNAYYIYSVGEGKWLTYPIAGSYSNKQNFVELSETKGDDDKFYFRSYNLGEYYDIAPYNTSNVASKYLNWYQGGGNTLGLYQNNADSDNGSKWYLIPKEIQELSFEIVDRDFVKAKNFVFWFPSDWEKAADVPTGINTDIQAGITNDNVYCITQTVTVKNAATLTALFNYRKGDNRLDIVGVDLVKEDGTVAVGDYHFGYTGNNAQNNLYELPVTEVGTYTIRYFVSNKSEALTSDGLITLCLYNKVNLNGVYRLKNVNLGKYLEFVEPDNNSGMKAKDKCTVPDQWFSFTHDARFPYYKFNVSKLGYAIKSDTWYAIATSNTLDGFALTVDEENIITLCGTIGYIGADADNNEDGICEIYANKPSDNESIKWQLEEVDETELSNLVRTPEDLVSGAGYYIKSDRAKAFLCYNSATPDVIDKAVAYNEENCIFAYYKSPNTSKHYLYNTGAGKFVGEPTNGKISLTEEVESDKLTFYPTTLEGYSIMMSTDGGSSSLHCNNSKEIISWSGGISNNWDHGNAFCMFKQLTIDEETLATIADAVGTYELPGLKAELQTLIDEATPYTLKEYLSENVKTDLTTAITEAQELISTSASASDVYAKTLEFRALIKRAQYVTNVNDLTNNAVYTIVSKYGNGAYVMYDENTTPDYAISSSKFATLEKGETLPSCQWAIYKSESGNYYMYSIGAGKFVGTTEDGDASIPLSAKPTSHKLIFKASTDSDYHLLISVNNGTGVLNHNNGGSFTYGLLNWKGGFNNTGDAANVHRITPVAAIDESTLASIEELVEKYEEVGIKQQELKEYLDEIKTKYYDEWNQNWRINSGLNNYSQQEGDEDFVTAYNEAREYETSEDTDAIQAQIDRIKGLIDGLTINLPENGKYYRIRCTRENRYMSSNTNDDNKVKMNGTGDASDATSIFYYDGAFMTFATGLYISAASGAKNVKPLAVGSRHEYTIEDGSINQKPGSYLIKVNGRYLYGYGDIADSGDRQPTNGSDHGYNWWFEAVTSLPVTITDAGYATFHAPVEVTIPEADAVTAHTVTINGNWATLNEIEGKVIPANTPVILNGTAGTYNLAITTTDAAAIDGNALSGTVAAEYATTEKDVFVLAKVESNVGLYKANTATSFTLKSHAAYLALDKADPANNSVGYRFGFDGTTAVEKVEMRNEKEAIYDLQGRRINEITEPGIYIVNGVKRVVR